MHIGRETDGMRLDIALLHASALNMSRRKIRRLIDAGGVYINKKRVRIASRTVSSGDKLQIYYKNEELAKNKAPVHLDPKDIVSVNDSFVLLNKPAGIPSQATRDDVHNHVLAALSRWFTENDPALDIKPKELQLAHRLDRETSGLLIVGRGKKSTDELSQVFRDKKMRKTYIAIVYGRLKRPQVTIKNNLKKSTQGHVVVKPSPHGGQYAETHFGEIAFDKRHKLSIVACAPSTGRTHQIRTHLESAGVSLVGDKCYQQHSQFQKLESTLRDLAADRHMLHASRLEWTLGNQSFKYQCKPTGTMFEMIEAVFGAVPKLPNHSSIVATNAK